MSQEKEIMMPVACKVPALVKMKLVEQSEKKGMSLSEYVALHLSVMIKNKNLEEHYENNLARFIRVLSKGNPNEENKLIEIWEKTKL